MAHEQVITCYASGYKMQMAGKQSLAVQVVTFSRQSICDANWLQIIRGGMWMKFYNMRKKYGRQNQKKTAPQPMSSRQRKNFSVYAALVFAFCMGSVTVYAAADRKSVV